MNDSVRNPAATTTGASVALVLAWVWNDIMAVQYKWPAMPEAVVVVLSVFVVDVARELMRRQLECSRPTIGAWRPLIRAANRHLRPPHPATRRR
jgi:hypothetical protein